MSNLSKEEIKKKYKYNSEVLESPEKAVYETIQLKGKRKDGVDFNVQLFGKKISGYNYKLNEDQKAYNKAMTDRSNELNRKYIITFGKYKGRKIVDMVSDEEYKYCLWLYNTMKKNESKASKRKSRKYKAFAWRVKYNKEIMASA